jgi:hypothetical protein
MDKLTKAVDLLLNHIIEPPKGEDEQLDQREYAEALALLAEAFGQDRMKDALENIGRQEKDSHG